ncbi:hypothetical protein KC19_VG083100 [Ceratodon purpureus]|uniref:Uncharacterized protein n=1 Tax=Ceratodon purpureus TaxID=3225 RepID=A0A8T0HN81_CERPU|nr:hypothetical protein KC19_VG083100 [Ceratodon purpureus]
MMGSNCRISRSYDLSRLFSPHGGTVSSSSKLKSAFPSGLPCRIKVYRRVFKDSPRDCGLWTCPLSPWKRQGALDDVVDTPVQGRQYLYRDMRGGMHLPPVREKRTNAVSEAYLKFMRGSRSRHYPLPPSQLAFFFGNPYCTFITVHSVVSLETI